MPVVSCMGDVSRGPALGEELYAFKGCEVREGSVFSRDET